MVLPVDQEKIPAYQEVARWLEGLILDGTLPPGKRMPSERRLSERMNFSRPLIREALKELRGRGVIHTHHGRGSYVAEMVVLADRDGSALEHSTICLKLENCSKGRRLTSPQFGQMTRIAIELLGHSWL